MGGSDWEGGLATHFNSADLGAGGSLRTSYSAGRFGLSASVVGRRASTLRAGEGEDSHNALTRFFGVSSKPGLDEGRLPDTAFTQYGGLVKAAFAAGPGSQLRLSYLRSQQDGGKRYDQLLGSDGNLVADLRNLMADSFYTRLEKAEAGPFDRMTFSYSWNAQREERVNQGGNGNPRATIIHEPERTVAHGVQASAQRLFSRHSLGVGADLYLESMQAPPFGTDPAGSGPPSSCTPFARRSVPRPGFSLSCKQPLAADWPGWKNVAEPRNANVLRFFSNRGF